MKRIGNWLRSRRWARRTLVCAAVLFVLVNIISFLVAPPVIRNVAARKLSEALKRPVSIEKVFLNPYALSVTVTRFKIAEPGGREDFVRFDRLYVNAQMMSLFKLAPVVREVTLERPYAHVVRTAERQFNFSDLAEGGAKPAAREKPGKPFRFSINGIHVVDGRLLYEDKVVGKKHVVAAINVSVPSVSNFPYYIETGVQPTISATLDGTPLAVTGTTKPFAETMETTLDLSMKGLDVPYYLAYSPVQPNCELKSAKLTVNAVLKYVQSTKGTPVASVTADVALEDVAVAGKAGEPVFNMPELRLEGARFEYPAMKCGCRRVLIREPDLNVSRGKEGKLNLLALLLPPAAAAEAPGTATPPPPAAAPVQSPLFVEVGLVQLVKARLSFADAVNRDPFQTVLAPVDLEVRDFSTADNAKATYSFALATEARETVKLSGQFAVAPALAVEGDVEAAQILLKKYAPYYADKTLFSIESGEVDLGTHYMATLNGKDLAARVSAAHFALNSLKLVRHGEQEPFLVLPSFSVTGAEADLAKREAVVDEVATVGAEITVQRLKSGEISLQKLLPPFSAEVSGTTVATAPAAPAPAAAKPWVVTLKHLLLDQYAIQVSDQMPETPVGLALDQVKVEVKNASTAEGAPNGSATVSMRINQTGTLTSESTFTVAPLTAQTKFELKGFDLRPFQPYFTDRVKVILTSAQLSVGGVVDAALPAGGTPQIAYKGDVRLEGLGVVGKGDAEEIAKWNALEIDGIDAKLSPLSVDVAEAVLDKLALRIVIGADGKINMTDLLAGQPASPAAPAPAAAPAANAANAAAPAAPLPVRLAKITFRDCQLAFVDHSLKPSFAMNVGAMSGVISGFALDGSQTGNIDLKGKIDNSGPVTITGKIKPVKDDLLVDIHFLLDAMELGGLTPYTGKFLGYKVERGKLSLDLHYNIVKRQLESTNTIFLDQFHLGDKVDSPTATNLPVNLALSLLRDRHGEIHLDVPVNGSFDDPKFRVFPIILQVLVNLVEKAVTSPFALLAGGSGGGEEMSYIMFDNGSSLLKETEIKKLDTLAKALDNRPTIKVQMQGRADPLADRLALLQAAFDNKLKAQKLKELAAKGEKMPDTASIHILPEEYGRYLAKAYAEARFQRPPGTAKKPSVQEMESLLKASMAVSDDDLRLLAYDRGLKVREYVMGKNVEAQRLYVLEPKVAPADENGKPGAVPAASTMFTIKMGKGGLPVTPDEKDDTPLVAAPPVVAAAVAPVPSAAPSSPGPVPITTPPGKPGFFERIADTLGRWF